MPMKFGGDPVYRYASVQRDARAYVRASDVPKLNIPRSVHPGIAIKINGSPALQHPPHLRRGLCFIYDTTELKVMLLFLSLPQIGRRPSRLPRLEQTLTAILRVAKRNRRFNNGVSVPAQDGSRKNSSAFRSLLPPVRETRKVPPAFARASL